MRSRLAADLRRELHDAMQRVTPAERVRLALELGARDLAAFAAAQGLTLDEAAQRLRSAAQRGRRRPSACAE
jgi:signal transduction histidine kinase